MEEKKLLQLTDHKLSPVSDTKELQKKNEIISFYYKTVALHTRNSALHYKTSIRISLNSDDPECHYNRS